MTFKRNEINTVSPSYLSSSDMWTFMNMLIKSQPVFVHLQPGFTCSVTDISFTFMDYSVCMCVRAHASVCVCLYYLH